MTTEFGSEGTSSESTVGINIKTLDSRIFSLRVNKNIPIPALKEKILASVGVPIEQQRLIYRGKVLKDEQLLSELHMEDGDTLHLVVRKPAQPQPTSSTGAEASRTSTSQGNDSDSRAQRNRVGHVAHSVLLGTVNVADGQGENMLADLNRSIEAFLGSLGMVTIEPNGGPNFNPSISMVNFPSGNGAEISQNSSTIPSSNATQEGFMLSNNSLPPNLMRFSQFPFAQTSNQPMVISDSLTTLSAFIIRMKLMLQTHTTSESNVHHESHSEVSSLDERGLPTPEFLRLVMDRVQQLLTDNAASALSHLSTRLQREGGSSDPVLRGQIQAEAMQLGAAMLHLGSMLLELGRTIMTLRMGQSPAESSVNAGPAIYISSTGPNPIMVQPSSLFGMPSPPSVSGLSVGATPGSPLSNINIHLHAGNSIAPVSSAVGMTDSSEPTHGERSRTEPLAVGVNGSRDTIPTRGLPLRTADFSTTPAQSAPEATGRVISVTYPIHIRAHHSTPLQFASPRGTVPIPNERGQSREQLSVPPSVSIPALVAQVTAHITNALTGNAQALGSSAVMPSGAGQDSYPCVGSGTQSELSNSVSQPSQLSSNDMHATLLNMEGSLLSADSQAQNTLSRHQPTQESNSREEILACQEDLLSVGNEGTKHDSVIAVTEHAKLNDSEKNTITDLSSSGKEGKKQIQFESNQISSVGSGIINEEAFVSSSSNGSQSIRMSSSSSDIEALKREPDSVQQPPHLNSSIGSNMPTPLGLGFGGLLTSKKMKPTKANRKEDRQAGQSSSIQDLHSISRAQEALGSLPSQTVNADNINANGSSSQLSSLFSQFNSSMLSGGQTGNANTDFSSVVANAMQSSAFGNLLNGMASQSGVSTGDLRSMLEQCVQSPAVQNTVNQLVQQVGQIEDNGNLGQGTGQGRLDFTGMIQQMLPAVSQVLGSVATRSASINGQSENQTKSNDSNTGITSSQDVFCQADLRQVLDKIEQNDDPRIIFGALLESTARLYGDNSIYQDIEELGNDEELANEFMEVLKHDIICRLEEEQ